MLSERTRAFAVSTDGMAVVMPMNHNGIIGRMVSIGGMYASSDGSSYTFVPNICHSCQHYDPGEYGDYGSKLSPAYCERNVWFPTKKGTCRWYDGYSFQWNRVLSVWLAVGQATPTDNTRRAHSV